MFADFTRILLAALSLRFGDNILVLTSGEVASRALAGAYIDGKIEYTASHIKNEIRLWQGYPLVGHMLHPNDTSKKLQNPDKEWDDKIRKMMECIKGHGDCTACVVEGM